MNDVIVPARRTVGPAALCPQAVIDALAETADDFKNRSPAMLDLVLYLRRGHAVQQ